MTEWQWVIKINNEVSDMANTTAESAHWSKRSIYRVPACVTDLNKKAYKPQMVSFGPYHHEEENLRAMEAHKHRALLHFLKRAGKPLQSYVDALAPVVQDLKDAYDQLDLKWQEDTEAFLQLMILDGCFILEMLWTTTTTSSTSQQISATDQIDQHAPQDEHDLQTPVADYASNDPIFSNHGKLYIVPYLKRDMLMLENQLPMLVLEKLAATTSLNDSIFFKRGGGAHGQELTKLILKFFSQTPHVKNIQAFGKCLHLLDVYRKSLLLEDPRRPPRKHKVRRSSGALVAHQGGDDIIRSATELNEAGIRIEKSRTRSLKDISFKGGVLRLPLIVVDDALEPLYLNLIAFERFHVGAGNEVTSYIFFMDNIIDSARDVSLLHGCGIVQNALGSDKAVAKLFNSLSKDITLDPESSLDDVHKQVSAYCQQSWHRWRANLIHTYFTNPWAILSVVAAVFLFALTILQTVYSVLAYVHPPAP